jgi:hypothetical protein
LYVVSSFFLFFPFTTSSEQATGEFKREKQTRADKDPARNKERDGVMQDENDGDTHR